MDWITNLLGVQSVASFGAKQVGLEDVSALQDVECSRYFEGPGLIPEVSVKLAKENLAVIPDDWVSSGVAAPWLNTRSADEVFVNCMNQLQQTEFIAFHEDFVSFLGSQAKLGIAHSFDGEDAKHVHEAPVYLPDTDEFLFADTSVVGWLWVLTVQTNEIRKVKTSPALPNVNGGTLHNGRLFLTTNGGSAPGIFECSLPGTREAKATSEEILECSPVVNNFRLNHLNSPNDLIFTGKGNILFTDPTYGWAQSWPGVGPPQLPTAVYHFDVTSKALTALDQEVLQPNGLALSIDGKTLYVADSNSTSGKPIGVWEDSVRNVYAFDYDESALKLSNKRLVHVVERGWPDGLRVTTSRSGSELLLVAMMGGVDIVDASKAGSGTLIGKFNVGEDIIFNLEPIQGKSARKGKAKDPGVWLLTGKKAVYKVEIAA